MGALEVMQEVGRAWQSMTELDRKYFKDKADNDKHRYLAESRKFYDEVARIGQQNTNGNSSNSAVKTGTKQESSMSMNKANTGGLQDDDLLLE